MLRHQSEIEGYAIHASDGRIGTVSDFLFEDTIWQVRWLVVDTGHHWFHGLKMVLLPPSALLDTKHTGRQFSVKLTKQQVEDSPRDDTDLPVSRQAEANIYNYYGWSPYWDSSSYMGPLDCGGYFGGSPVPSPEIDVKGGRKTEPTLRSIKEVIGYRIHACDGEIGHVEDVLVEDDDWSIRYLVVETTNWWPGTKVLISPGLVQAIQWADQQMNLSVDRQMVKGSSEYDPSATIDPTYQKPLHQYNSGLRTPVSA